MRDDPPLDQFVGQELHRPADPSFGGIAATDGDEVGFGLAIENRGHGRRFAGLAVEGRGFSLEDEPLADLVDRVRVHLKEFAHLGAGEWPSFSCMIAQQQELGMPDLLGGGVPVAADVAEVPTLLVRQHDGILIRRRPRHGEASLQEG